MTPKQLLDFFEQYYGEKYTGIFLDTMISYLNGYSENFLKHCASVIILRFPRNGRSPCSAIIEKHLEEIYASIPKPEALPEPDIETERCSDEETAEYMRQIKQIFERKTPMSETLSKTLDEIRGRTA